MNGEVIFTWVGGVLLLLLLASVVACMFLAVYKLWSEIR